jgi:hypothetical protein
VTENGRHIDWPRRADRRRERREERADGAGARLGAPTLAQPVKRGPTGFVVESTDVFGEVSDFTSKKRTYWRELWLERVSPNDVPETTRRP